MSASGKLDKIKTEAKTFFDSFVTAFATFDGEVVAQLFTHPYMAVDTSGNGRVFNSAPETAAYFQEFLDEYHRSGSRTCSYESMEAVPIGCLAAVVSVKWVLHSADGSETTSWSESYCVSREHGKMLAYASMDHAKEP